MQKRKGFTLVELVIVIAVIAILAGVLIGTFASVINRANESAKMQEMKAQELEQKADDILKKIDNSNWYGWEDFESSIVEKLTVVYKANASSSASISEIEKALKVALDDFAKNHANDNTSLTADQVKAIVENAFGSFTFEGVTEAQVRTIVNTAVDKAVASNLTASQVKSIVNAANANNLTANEVSALLASKLANVTTKEDLTAQINAAVTSITSTINQVALSEEDVADLLKAYLPVTVTATSPAEFETFTGDGAGKLNSGSTIYIDSNITTDLTINSSEYKTLYIRAVNYTGTLEINAPLATIELIGNFGTVNAIAVNNSSLHIVGQVTTLTLNSGRAVVEEGSSVGTFTAAPTPNAVVEVENKAEITTLIAEYQKNGTGTYDTITVENTGSITHTNLTVVATELISGETEITTNVKATGIQPSAVDGTAAQGQSVVIENKIYDVADNGENAGELTGGINDYTVVLLGQGEETDPYVIRTVEELETMSELINGANASDYQNKYWKITQDLDISDITWVPLGKAEAKPFAGTIIGSTNPEETVTLTGLNNWASGIYVGEQLRNHSTTWIVGELYGFIAHTTGTVTVQGLTFDKVDINTKTGKEVGAIVAGVNVDNTKVTLSYVNVSGKLKGQDKVAGLVGYAAKSGANNIKVNIDHCNVSVDVFATEYRAGGIIAQIGDGAKVELSNVSFEGSVDATGKETIKQGEQVTNKCIGAITGFIGTGTDRLVVENFTLSNVSNTNIGEVLGVSSTSVSGLVVSKQGIALLWAQNGGTTQTNSSVSATNWKINSGTLVEL